MKKYFVVLLYKLSWLFIMSTLVLLIPGLAEPQDAVRWTHKGKEWTGWDAGSWSYTLPCRWQSGEWQTLNTSWSLDRQWQSLSMNHEYNYMELYHRQKVQKQVLFSEKKNWEMPFDPLRTTYTGTIRKHKLMTLHSYCQ